MRLIKFSSVFAVLGFVFLTLSYFAAKGLEQSKTYTFPESVGRHYAQVSGNFFEGGTSGDTTVFKKSIPVDVANPIDTVEIETIAIDVEVSHLAEGNDIEIELKTNRVDPKEPILIDSSHGKTLRIMTQEDKSGGRVGKRGWMVFNFDDDDNKSLKNNVLQIRVPKSISNAKVQTVSGDTQLATALASLHVQSKSGDVNILTTENPLARVEMLTVETVSGDLKGPGRFDRLRFNSVSGDMKLTSLDRVLDIDGATVSGDAKISATEPVDASIEFHTTSGDLRVAPSLYPNGTDRKMRPRKNTAFTLGKGTARIKFNSVSGDLRISPPKTGKEDDATDENQDDSDEENRDEAKLMDPNGPSRVGNAMYAEEFLQCVAQIAAREQTKIGASAARRCFRVIVETTPASKEPTVAYETC